MQQFWNEINTISAFIWIVIQVLIGYNLIVPIIFYLVHKIVGKNPILTDSSSSNECNDYAIIITAYRQTEQIETAVKSALQLRHSNFMVYVVADNCDPFILPFSDERLNLLFPEKSLANNLRSHQYAISKFRRKHNRVVIIDSDNLIDISFLEELDRWFDNGYQAVQGLRSPKNLNTNLACLDAARDIFYAFYDGKILFQLGSSSTLSGSGMAFDADIYSDLISKIKSEGAGFDKLVQYELLKKDVRIAHAPKAIVYDEKTAYSAQLLKQRTRWIKTWFNYFSFGFSLILKGIGGLNRNQSLFGLILLRPPLFIFLLLSCACLLVNLWINPTWSLYWLTALILFVFSFMIATFRKDTDPRILKSLKNIPQFIIIQLKSLFLSSKINHDNVATEHYQGENRIDSLDSNQTHIDLKHNI